MTGLIPYLGANLMHWLGVALNAIAFDVATNFAVSFFGYSLNASFAKAKETKKASKGFFGGIWASIKSFFRGSSLVATFHKSMDWMIAHKVDILVSAVTVVAGIIAVRYVFTHLWHTAAEETKTKTASRRR